MNIKNYFIAFALAIALASVQFYGIIHFNWLERLSWQFSQLVQRKLLPIQTNYLSICYKTHA